MKNVMEAVIVNKSDMAALMLRDDNRMHMIGRSIANWLANMRRRSKLERFLCLDCKVAFHDRRLPEAFAVTLPFAQNDGQAVTTGICRRCIEKETDVLMQKFTERLRAYYPDLTIIRSGQA